MRVFVTSAVGEFFCPTLGIKSMVNIANSPHLDGDFNALTEVHVPPILKPTVYVTVTNAISFVMYILMVD